MNYCNTCILHSNLKTQTISCQLLIELTVEKGKSRGVNCLFMHNCSKSLFYGATHEEGTVAYLGGIGPCHDPQIFDIGKNLEKLVCPLSISTSGQRKFAPLLI